MRNRLSTLLTLSVMAALLASCANGSVAGTSLRHKFMLSEPPADAAPTQQVIKLASNGRASMDGKTISPAEIAALAAELHDSVFLVLSIEVAADAKAQSVVQALSRISNGADYEFAGTDMFGRFDLPKTPEGDPIAVPDFEGARDRYELPVVVHHAKKTDQCAIALQGRTMGSAELYDGAFYVLDTIVQLEGCAEAVLANQEVFDSLIAKLQTSLDTPWRCVAAALSIVEATGWPTVELKLTR